MPYLLTRPDKCDNTLEILCEMDHAFYSDHSFYHVYAEMASHIFSMSILYIVLKNNYILRLDVQVFLNIDHVLYINCIIFNTPFALFIYSNMLPGCCCCCYFYFCTIIIFVHCLLVVILTYMYAIFLNNIINSFTLKLYFHIPFHSHLITFIMIRCHIKFILIRFKIYDLHILSLTAVNIQFIFNTQI